MNAAAGTTPGGVRPAAVAGSFYPADPDDLAAGVDAALAAAGRAAGGPASRRPRALVVPHAGYVYSGAVAARAFARLLPWRDRLERVVLAGPAHRVPVRALALSSARRWATPLGTVAVDAELTGRLLDLPGVEIDDGAHGPEHAIEVELPFLQRALDHPFALVPLVVGHAPTAEVADVLDAAWDGDGTIVVVSSDLSHYEDHDGARRHDRRTADRILAGRLDEIGPDDACGAAALRGLLAAARRRRLDIELVDLRTSGDTAGPTDRVVGYGAFVLTPSGPAGRRAWRPAGEEATAAASGDAGWVLSTSEGGPPPADGSGPPPRVPGPPTPDHPPDEREAAIVVATAVEAIRARFEERAPEPAAGDAAPRLLAPAATFVTLRDGRRMLGCIGSLDPQRALLDDVAANATGAAFEDPRQPVLTPFEFARMTVQVSVLTPLVELRVTTHVELGGAVTPGRDGLVIECGDRQATFLPMVWRQVPAVADFLAQLWRKAGLSARAWPPDVRVWRYRTVELVDDGPRGPVRSAAPGARSPGSS